MTVGDAISLFNGMQNASGLTGHFPFSVMIGRNLSRMKPEIVAIQEKSAPSQEFSQAFPQGQSQEEFEKAKKKHKSLLDERTAQMEEFNRYMKEEEITFDLITMKAADLMDKNGEPTVEGMTGKTLYEIDSILEWED